MKYTLAFSERTEGRIGWNSFFTYYPDLMLSLGNKFYTIKDGQLWEHNDNENSIHGTIYNQQLHAKIITIINEQEAEDKIFKNIILESNKAWDTKIKTNLSESTIQSSEYNNRESKWFAHTRKDENNQRITDRTQGIGIIQNVENNIITFSSIPTLVSVNETLYQIENNQELEIGIITNIEDNKITIDNIINTPQIKSYAFSLKNSRIQGAEIRGYYAEIELENKDTDKVELFAVNSNIIQSFAPTNYK